MITVGIDKNNKKYFEQMDPMYLLGNTSDRNVALGGLIEDPRSNKYIPIGLAICTETENAVVILWMYIVPKYQRNGYGDELLRSVVDLAKEKKKENVCAYFDDSFLRRSICFGDKIYFKEHGFKTEHPLYGEWMTDIKNMLCKPFFNGIKLDDRVVELKRISKRQQKDLIDFILDNDYSYNKYLKENAEKIFDMDLSSVIFGEDNEVRAAILVTIHDGIIFPVSFFANYKEDVQTLIYGVLNTAKKRYGQDMPVSVVLFHEEYASIMNSIMPEEKINNTILLAPVSYFEDKSVYNADEFDEFADLSIFEYELESDELENYIKPGEDIVVVKKDVMNLSVFKDVEINCDIHTIGELDIKRFFGVLLDCHYYGYSGVLNCLPEQMNAKWFNTELSCYVENDKHEITSVYFVGIKENGDVFPLMLFTKNPDNKNEILGVMKYIYDKIMDHFSDDTRICMRNHDKRSEALINMILKR